MDYYAYLGTVGWDDGENHLALYPEDLPSDWRLAFYATQYRCVYLPIDKWARASDEEVVAWLGETQDTFRFVLESPDQPKSRYRALAERFGRQGVLESDIDLHWLGEDVELRKLSAMIRSAVEQARPVYLIFREPKPALMRQVEELMEILGV